jgi:hypothetical protein
LAQSDVTSQLTLYVPFEQSIDAAIAAGDPTGAWQGKEAKPQFTTGLIGRGLLISSSSDDQTIRYMVEKNLPRAKGCMTFWSRGIKDWNLWKYHSEGGVSSGFLGFSGPDGWALFYKWNYATDGIWLLTNIGGKTDVIQTTKFDPFQWTMFALCWEGDKVRVYVNGNLIASRDDYHLPNFTETFFFGHGGAPEKGLDTRRVLDELKVYGRMLTPSEIKRQYRQEAASMTDPLVTIPLIQTPITLDGKISDDEWGGAAVISGLLDSETGSIGIGEQAETPTYVYLCRDVDHLHVAMNSATPAKVKARPEQYAMQGLLQTAKLAHDEDVDADDAFELTVFPEWVSNPDGILYRMVTNSLGTLYEYTIPQANTGALDLHWNPAWESVSTSNLDGWQMEARIPLNAFGAEPRVGDVWGMNFQRLWRKLESGLDTWAWGVRDAKSGEYVDHQYYHVTGRYLPQGLVRFGGEDAIVVQIQRIGRLAEKDLDFVANVVNPGGNARSVATRLTMDSGEVKDEQTFTLAPGASRQILLRRTLKDFTSSTLIFEVEDTANHQLIHRTVVPFFLKQSLDIRLRHYPSYGEAYLDLDISMLSSVAPTDLQALINLRSVGKDTPVLTLEPLTFTAHHQTTKFSTRDLPIGKYEIDITVTAKGAVVAQERKSYEKQAMPEWFNNTLGESDTFIPTPFEAMKLDTRADAFSVWGRKYAFEGQLLPVQVETQGSGILSAPMRLVVTDAAGRETSSDTAKAPVTWTKTTPARLEFTRALAFGGVKVECNGWAEYDGLTWFTMKILPDQVTSIDGLRLEIPFRKEWSELFNPYDYGASISGFLPKEEYATSLRPIWLGNGTGGMQWLAETDGTWSVADRGKAVRIIPSAQGAVLRVEFANIPTDLAKAPLEVAFGINASPVRPKTPGYRHLNTWDGEVMLTCGAWTYQQRFNPVTMKRWTLWYDVDPESTWAQQSDVQAEHVTAGVYVTTSGMHPDSPEYAYWQDEWTSNPNFRYVYNPAHPNRDQSLDVPVCQESKSWRDFFVWYYAKYLDETPVRGCYADDGPNTCTNTLHGCGVRGRDGVLFQTNAYLGYREINKRLYTLLRSKYPDGTYSVHHMSGQHNLACDAFFDYYADGENFTSRLSMKEPGYWSHYRVDSFKAQSMGHNFGPAGWFLHELSVLRGNFVDPRSGEDPEKVYELKGWLDYCTGSSEYMHGLIMLHDSCIWEGNSLKSPLARLRAALRKYGWGMQYQFVPYWEQQIVKLDGPDQYVSFYLDKANQRALILFLNNADTEGIMTWEPQWEALGFDDPRGLRVENAAHAYLGPEKNWAKIDGDALQFTYGTRNYRLIAITRPR